MTERKINFCPPDISEEEINEVIDTLKSGWITTGPKVKKFEREIADFCGTNKAVCLNSATACLEMILRILKIGQGDEVITSAYTYTASCSPIYHVGAKAVLIDTSAGSFEMDYDLLEKSITEKTKAIILVDIAGVMCDYEKVFEIVKRKSHLFCPRNDIEKKIGRVVVIADAAHSFGAKRFQKRSGSVADFTFFSLHAVKNLTTAEGGAATWKSIPGINDDDLYKEFMLLSLHGQSKDALAKSKLGNWEYDILIPGYKCNMTDVLASIGLAQLRRYERILSRRREIIETYDESLKNENVTCLKHYGPYHSSSGHLYLVNLNGKDRVFRDELIKNMAKKGVSTNVHYKPLPLFTAYKNLGFDIKDFPNALSMYENEVTLPLHTLLSDEEVYYVLDVFNDCLKNTPGA